MKKNLPLSGNDQQNRPRPDSPGPHSRYGRPAPGPYAQQPPYGEYHTGRRPAPPQGRRPYPQGAPAPSGRPPIPPVQRMAVEQPEPVEKPKKNKAVPIMISLIVILGIAAGAIFFLRNRAIKMKAQEAKKEYAQRVNTNAYRVNSKKAKTAAAGLFEGTTRLADLFSGNQEIDFRETDEKISYVDNQIDYPTINEVAQHPMNIGWMAFPSIGANGPLMVGDSMEALSDGLLYGFGIVNYRVDDPTVENGRFSQMSEPGQTTILGHRCLSQHNSFYYLHEVEVGDPYFIDDYRLGERFYYNTVSTKIIQEAELNSHVYVNPDEVNPNYGKAPKDGYFSLLVVCEPLEFDSSVQRILVYGELEDRGPIPADNLGYRRYLEENGLPLPALDEAEDKAGEAAEAENNAEGAETESIAGDEAGAENELDPAQEEPANEADPAQEEMEPAAEEAVEDL